jgi:hypothetical protein
MTCHDEAMPSDSRKPLHLALRYDRGPKGRFKYLPVERHISQETASVAERCCDLRRNRFRVEICGALAAESDIDWL